MMGRGRPPDTTLPRCPQHPGSAVRRDGSFGDPPRPRLRCFYIDPHGTQRKHGLRPAPKPAGIWDKLPGGRFAITEVATALTDLARGLSYTEAARRVQINHVWADPGSVPTDDDATALSGITVAGWLDRFGAAIAGAYAETAWPEALVLDSTEFVWTNPRTGDKQQMFCVLAAWGYPAGARRGRLWALAASPSDDAAAWMSFLGRLAGRPAMVVYDSDKAIHSAVRRKWRNVPIHLCEHHLYENAKKHLREDGQAGWGNRYRTLLKDAGQSPEGWDEFQSTVTSAPGLTKTQSWVRHWDRQMTAQTARRSTMPPHYSTGALDPHIAVVRHMLERRRWTFRNLARMNTLLGLVRLHVNRRDVPADWAKLIAGQVAAEREQWVAPSGDYRRGRPRARVLDEEATVLFDGSREYSLRKHPVPPRSGT
jgi:hypothetical protein